MMRRLNIPKWITYALFILFTALIQTQAAFYPRFMDVTPVFLIPAAVFIAMFEGETVGGIYGIAAGLLWDCGTGRVFGFNAFFLMIEAIAVGLFFKFLLKNSLFSALIFTAVITALHETITWFFFYFMTGSRNFIFALLHITLPTTALTLIFALPLFFLVRFINDRLTESNNSDMSV